VLTRCYKRTDPSIFDFHTARMFLTRKLARNPELTRTLQFPSGVIDYDDGDDDGEHFESRESNLTLVGEAHSNAQLLFLAWAMKQEDLLGGGIVSDPEYLGGSVHKILSPILAGSACMPTARLNLLVVQSATKSVWIKHLQSLGSGWTVRLYPTSPYAKIKSINKPRVYTVFSDKCRKVKTLAPRYNQYRASTRCLLFRS